MARRTNRTAQAADTLPTETEIAAVDVVATSATTLLQAASGRALEKTASEAVQPVINALWSAGGSDRDLILRIADRVSRDAGQDATLKNAALSILRVRASRAQKAAGDPEQGITLRSGIAQWGAPKAPPVKDYIGEALALLAKGVEAGRVDAKRLETVAQVLLGSVQVGDLHPVGQDARTGASVVAPAPTVARSLLQRLRMVA